MTTFAARPDIAPLSTPLLPDMYQLAAAAAHLPAMELIGTCGQERLFRVASDYHVLIGPDAAGPEWVFPAFLAFGEWDVLDAESFGDLLVTHLIRS